jgi:hypothetical protein
MHPMTWPIAVEDGQRVRVSSRVGMIEVEVWPAWT